GPDDGQFGRHVTSRLHSSRHANHRISHAVTALAGQPTRHLGYPRRVTFASALYRGTLVHTRRDELARRAFSYPVYVAALDLSELPALDAGLRLFSHGGRNLFAFNDADYAATLAPSRQAGSGTLAAQLAVLLAGNGLPAPHTTRLVTNLRVWGYV